MKAKFNVKISTSAISELEPMASMEMQVFLFLASKMDATNQVILGAYSRKEFAKSIDTSSQYISNAIQALKKKGLFICYWQRRIRDKPSNSKKSITK